MATVTAGYTWTSGETVTPAKLNSAAAPTVVVANDEITTAKILDANVTAAKLASNAVETAKIADDAVSNDKLSLSANAGEIKKAINADNAPPIFACRAWVNFDGSAGGTVDGEFRCTIRASGNVSKVVRSDTGVFLVTFATPMIDDDYVANCSVKAVDNTSNHFDFVAVRPDSASVARIVCSQPATPFGGVNAAVVMLSVFR
jgi:hypothetical protein